LSRIPRSISFFKYQSTGNDFVLIDNRKGNFPDKDNALIHKLCDRKFGIGADGLILLETSEVADFTMQYYNADGSLGSFCGNGSRAIVSFAKFLGIIENSSSFEAYDGMHEAIISGNIIQVKMADVQNGRQILNGTFIDTGSPHYVEFVENLNNIDVVQQGRAVRNSVEFEPNGSNINYVEKVGPNKLKVRTYERGVENETLSCGTGVTASAIAAITAGMGKSINISTLGGDLKVSFEQNDSGYHNIWLEGPTEMVFSGEIEL
jgi:diaminopimelate epimerase